MEYQLIQYFPMHDYPCWIADLSTPLRMFEEVVIWAKAGMKVSKSDTYLCFLDIVVLHCHHHYVYIEGKLAKKPNTFFDFCSAAEHLIKEGYTKSEQLSIYGRSAGGLLIGACVNLRPELFRSALTEVPFVDVINTMFDPTIPWTGKICLCY